MKYILIISSILLFTTFGFSQRGRLQFGFVEATTKDLKSIDFKVKNSIRYYLLDNFLVSFAGYSEKSAISFRYYPFSTAGSYLDVGRVINITVDNSILLQLGYSKNFHNIWVEPFISTEFSDFNKIKNADFSFGIGAGISIN